jgi:hypothetical protein
MRQEGSVIRRKLSPLVPAGLLLLSASIAVPRWTHSPHPDFLTGFLFGASIGLLVLGLVRRSRRVSR